MISDSSVLEIARLGPDHRGRYDCSATNSEGRAEDSLTIDVLCK
jgi:hypothetical protein